MQSKATTVAEYLDSLPLDRRVELEAVRTVFLANLDRDFAEGMQYGMIGYCVPHRIHPAGYHCNPEQPLPYAGIAAQKNHLSLYLMSVYGDSELASWFRDAWAKTGKKLDMGKACIRFQRADDLALDVIAETLRRMPVQRWIEVCTAWAGSRKSAAKRPAQKAKGKAGSTKGAKAAKGAKGAAGKKASSKKAPKPSAAKRRPAR